MPEYQELISIIERQTRIAIICHVSPDGDTLGSGFALFYALESMGKKVDIICADEMPKTYAFLDPLRRLSAHTNAGEYDLVIAVDCADSKRMGEAAAILANAPISMNLDHHISNNEYAQYNLVMPDRAATGCIIFDLISAVNPKCIDQRIAQCLFVALSTDTGHFAYSNTNQRCMQIAGELINFGAVPQTITELLYRNRTLGKTRLIAKTIDNMQLFHDGRLCISTLTSTDMAQAGAESDDVEGMVNYLREVEGVEVALLIREDNGAHKCSLRSKKYVDTTLIAEEFGGGGHVRASGFKSRLQMNEIIQKVISKVKDLLADE